MNPDAQRVAIAEACGWTGIQMSACTELATGWKGGWKNRLPDYLNDLNAMHEAEKAANFTASQHGGYVEHLRGIVTRDYADDGWMCRCNADMCIYATAAQRAEAFLRAIGKWEST